MIRTRVQFPIIDLVRFKTAPYTCSYLPSEIASLEYRIPAHVTAHGYQQLLRRGWRRFGRDFFRPGCARCAKCRSLRINVDQFKPSRSQLRTLRQNSGIRVAVQAPTLTSDPRSLHTLKV